MWTLLLHGFGFFSAFLLVLESLVWIKFYSVSIRLVSICLSVIVMVCLCYYCFCLLVLSCLCSVWFHSLTHVSSSLCSCHLLHSVLCVICLSCCSLSSSHSIKTLWFLIVFVRSSLSFHPWFVLSNISYFAVRFVISRIHPLDPFITAHPPWQKERYLLPLLSFVTLCAVCTVKGSLFYLFVCFTKMLS